MIVFGLLLAASIAACDSEDDVRLITIGFVAMGGIVCIGSLRSAGDLQSQFGGALVENRAQGTFAQPNDLGTLADLVVFTALGLYIGAKTAGARLASGAAVLIGLAALVLSLSRGAWIGALLGLVAVFAVLPGGRRRLFRLGLALIVALLFFVAIRPATMQVVGDRLGTLTRPASNPYDPRTTIWREGFVLVNEQPLFGVGPGSFPAAAISPGAEPAAEGALHAQNTLLNVAAEAGLVAVALLVGFTLSVALSVTRAARGEGPLAARRIVVGVSAGLLAVAGQGLLDFTLRNPVLQISLWFTAGLTLAWLKEASAHVNASIPGASGDSFNVERRAFEILVAQSRERRPEGAQRCRVPHERICRHQDAKYIVETQEVLEVVAFVPEALLVHIPIARIRIRREHVVEVDYHPRAALKAARCRRRIRHHFRTCEHARSRRTRSRSCPGPPTCSWARFAEPPNGARRRSLVPRSSSVDGRMGRWS